jgi:hypothetical protein
VCGCPSSASWPPVKGVDKHTGGVGGTRCPGVLITGRQSTTCCVRGRPGLTRRQGNGRGVGRQRRAPVLPHILTQSHMPMVPFLASSG